MNLVTFTKTLTRITHSAPPAAQANSSVCPPPPFPPLPPSAPTHQHPSHRRPHPTMQPVPQKGPGFIMHIRAQARAPAGRAAEHDGAAEAAGGDGQGDDGR